MTQMETDFDMRWCFSCALHSRAWLSLLFYRPVERGDNLDISNTDFHYKAGSVLLPGGRIAGIIRRATGNAPSNLQWDYGYNRTHGGARTNRPPSPAGS